MSIEAYRVVMKAANSAERPVTSKGRRPIAFRASKRLSCEGHP